ncbi:MAG TPA: Stk1 family PASTA domain-containing Ser/Thr kinase [Gaiellaceae bacterium]|nr:Stk1 family PASTA domain-containing Ser/Thr kinase [Gaiellaceae bacterium]
MAEPLIDTLFDGRYRIARKLGAGGMANVYLAEDQELGRRVAIKILNDRHANDEQFVERFRREAKNAAALSHPNIVSIYDRGEAEGTYYIAMEYLDGRTLKELVVGRGPAPVNVAIEYTRQILSALRFAHRHGIVHRDIKPHNVLVDSEGRVKVTDFGIARAGTSQMTEAGSIVGTAQYLSPEQARGGDVDQRSDLYSLGIVLYELLTGETPFEGDTPVEIAMKHLSTAPEPPSALRSDIPRELDKVVLRALAKDPEDRYQSAEEMDADLERVARGAPVAAATEDSATRIMRIPAEAATSATMIAPRARPAYAPVYEEEYGEPPHRRAVWPWLAALAFVLIAAAGAWYVWSQVSSPAAKKVRVEYYVNLHRQEAEGKIEAIGLKPKVHKEANESFAAGLVFKQDPKEGDIVTKGSSVEIWVSTGKPKVQVPDVRGQSQDDAVKALTDAGLVPDIHTVPGGEAGKVTAEPDAGKTVVKGSKVWLNVASGPAPVTVIKVTGETLTQATADLHALGFKVNPTYVDDAAPANQVIEQSPKPGAKAPKNSTVELKVSNGPPQATVPDVTGEAQDQAVQDVKSQGFTSVKTEPVDVVDPSQDGIVQSQDPQGNTQAPTTTTVTLQVGHFVGDTTTATP